MIQFGDRGIVKGGFSSDTARGYFNRTAPLIYRAVNEPDGAERVRLALLVYQAAKPLWAARPQDRVEQAFREAEKRYAKHKAEGSGNGKTPCGAEDARNGRREKEMERQSVKEDAAILRDAGLMPDGDNDNKGEDGDAKGETPGRDKGGHASSSGQGQDQDGDDVDGSDDGPVFTYSPDIAEQFAEALERSPSGMDSSMPDSGEEPPEPCSETIRNEHKQFAYVKENNVSASPENIPDGSESILNTASWIAGALSTQLKKIFMDDRGGKAYAQCGKISMKRAASGRATTRMFERRILPGDKADMCLMLLIDLSGSMRGAKDTAAKTAAIALCEAFAYLRVPAYCMGFQHIDGFDAYQTHFVRWRNTPEERLSILSARPEGGNFDSYSIRYVTEM